MGDNKKNDPTVDEGQTGSMGQQDDQGQKGGQSSSQDDTSMPGYQDDMEDDLNSDM